MQRRTFLTNLALTSLAVLANPTFSQSINKDKKMNILVLGATGSLGDFVITELLHNHNVKLRLHSRNVKKLAKYQNHERIELWEGDVLEQNNLEQALNGIDAVYAGLAGDLVNMANSLVKAMNNAGVKRLVWITSYGIYGEADRGSTPPNSYINSAKVIENSNLDYTLIRPQWFSNVNEVNYEITHRTEKFKNPNAQISRKSIAHLVAKCIYEDFAIKDSLGINRPK